MLSDTEFLEKRLSLTTSEPWSLLVDELETLAKQLEKIQSVDTLEDLFYKKGQVDILSMIINLENTTNFTLEQLK